MEKYIGVKEVLAKPMNRKQYNDYRGWEVPADENPSDAGMLVEYIDGGKANHPNHTGYISWSPLDVFEKAYKQIDSIQQLSDGYHTFEELYHHRMMLFSVICNRFKEKFWKSKLHSDGSMYENYFIIGCDTPIGNYSYHFHIDNWHMFNCKEIETAPVWDGHKPDDIHRLLMLYREKSELSFGQAMEAVERGFLVARLGWNGKGMFVFMRPADEILAQTVIENIKSIPDAVKLFLHKKYKNDYIGVSGEPFKIKFTAYLCMYAADGSIVNGWNASQPDMLAKDWVILD